MLVESEAGKGTTFDIYLPKVASEASDQPLLSETVRQRKRAATVLLVEDEPLVRSATARVLLSAGLRVLEASTPDMALKLSAERPEKIDLLLTDVVLPTMNGRELADKVAKLRPRVRVLFMSGYTDDAFSGDELLDAGAAFLAKPFTPDTLVKRIDEVLAAQ